MKTCLITTSQGVVCVPLKDWMHLRPDTFLELVFWAGNEPDPLPGTELVRSLSVGDWIDYPVGSSFRVVPHMDGHMRVNITESGFAVVK